MKAKRSLIRSTKLAIEKEKNNADKLNRLEHVKIPANFDYDRLKSMSMEARQKLKELQPITISQA